MFLRLIPDTHKQKISRLVDRHTRYGDFDDAIQAKTVGAFLDGMGRDASGLWVEAS